jgi:hypothetical protein
LTWQLVGETSVTLPTALTPTVSAFPNPFNPSTTISFALPAPSAVELVVFDACGREVARLLDEWRSAGNHDVAWTGVDSRGRPVSSGLYFCRLSTPSDVETLKLSLVR